METTEERKSALNQIEKDVLGLKKSPLYKFRIENNSFPVIGEGSCAADIMFVGEAPGKKEALTGKPFCGASGRILDELLVSAKITREDVYITNIVKDRPPENRDPTPAEIALYGPFLDRQIEIIRPKVIASLGRFSMDYIMRHFGLDDLIEPIGKMHGRVFDAEAKFGPLKIVPLYHPAVAVYNAKTKDQLKKDFAVLKTI